MDKEFFDKYSKELQCAECFGLETCIKENSPYLTRCRNFIQNEKINQFEQQIADLETKLAEKDELLKQKICDMKSTDFIRMCVSCGFMVQAKQNDNQTAIAELEKVKEFIREFVGINDVKFICTTTITDQIDQQIKELKGEK
jgi:hypothetical protein